MTAVFYDDRLLIKPANIGESFNQNICFFNHGNPPGIEIKILPFRLNGRIGLKTDLSLQEFKVLEQVFQIKYAEAVIRVQLGHPEIMKIRMGEAKRNPSSLFRDNKPHP
jgi:hypothetical protein